MNVKLIARAMHTLSLLSEEDVAMVMNLRGLSDDERQTLLLVLEPDKPQKKAGKRPASKSSGKTARASGMAAAIDHNLSQRRREILDDVTGDSGDTRCQFIRADNKPCHLLPDHNIHHLESANEYHPFVSDAASAGEQSLVRDGATSSTASSEMGKGVAGTVAHGASGGAD